MDEQRYGEYQKEQFRKFESICTCCGACCGSLDGDPCTNLALNPATKKYYCRDYDHRLGPQKTKIGKIFNCVPIKDVAKHGYLRPSCAYRNII